VQGPEVLVSPRMKLGFGAVVIVFVSVVADILVQWYLESVVHAYEIVEEASVVVEMIARVKRLAVQERNGGGEFDFQKVEREY